MAIRFFYGFSDWMAIVRHANTDEGSNNGSWRENLPRSPHSRLSLKVEERPAKHAGSRCNLCTKYIQSEVTAKKSRGSRFATSYYLLIHFEQAAYASSSCLFHPSQQECTSVSGFASRKVTTNIYTAFIGMSRPKVYNIPPWLCARYGLRFPFPLAQTELNIAGLKYGSIHRIKESWRDSPGKRFRRDLFPRRERFSQEGRKIRRCRRRVCGAVQWPSPFNLQANWIFSEIKERAVYNRHETGRSEISFRLIDLLLCGNATRLSWWMHRKDTERHQKHSGPLTVLSRLSCRRTHTHAHASLGTWHSQWK